MTDPKLVETRAVDIHLGDVLDEGLRVVSWTHRWRTARESRHPEVVEVDVATDNPEIPFVTYDANEILWVLRGPSTPDDGPVYTLADDGRGTRELRCHY